MKKSRHSEEQIIEVLKQMEAGRKVAELAREVGVSETDLPSRLSILTNRASATGGLPAPTLMKMI